VRTVNEGAVLDFSEIRLWAVADRSAAPNVIIELGMQVNHPNSVRARSRPHE
jgi:hypothetical protein